MKRVMVVGGPGSGKSTFARALGEITGLPVYHMDMIHWLPGWVERERSVKSRMTSEVHRREAWIFEGGHSTTYPERVARADTIVWLDLPIGLRLWRVIKRRVIYHGKTRPDLPENCPEQFTWEFFSFIVRSRKRTRARHFKIKGEASHVTFHHLRSPADVRAFLAQMTAG